MEFGYRENLAVFVHHALTISLELAQCRFGAPKAKGAP
jgi:hypothetical protein